MARLVGLSGEREGALPPEGGRGWPVMLTGPSGEGAEGGAARHCVVGESDMTFWPLGGGARWFFGVVEAGQRVGYIAGRFGRV